MNHHGVVWRVLPALLTAVTLFACSAAPAPTPTARTTTVATCGDLAARIVDVVQAYVDSFAEVSVGEVTGAVSARQTEFTAATTALRERGRRLGCSASGLADLIRAELPRLKGGTPLQDAVAATFRAGPLGSADPSDPTPSETVVTTAEELTDAMSRAGSGSTIRLAAGTYEVGTPLVALRPITLVGAGDGTDPTRASTIRSSAAGGALLAATSGNLTLTDLAIEHTGQQVATVVVIAGGGYRFDRVRVAGGIAQGGAGGFGLVLRPTSAPLAASGDSRTLTDVRVDNNQGGGVVIAGSEQAAITRVRVTGTAGCGLCWMEAAGGTAQDVTIQGGKIGLRVDNNASPTVTRATVKDAEVGVALNGSGSVRIEELEISGGTIGVQATGSGTPALVDTRVADAKEIGLRLSGTMRPSLERVSVSGGTRIGIATVAQASPTITGGSVSSTGEAGLVWGEDATGTVTDVIVRGPALAVQLGASASVRLAGVVADGPESVSLLASGKSSGEASRLTCAKDGAGAVVLTESTTLRLVDSPTCKEYRK